MQKELRKYFSKLGKKGGKKTFEYRGKDYFRELGKKAAKARWGNKKETVDNSLDE